MDAYSSRWLSTRDLLAAKRRVRRNCASCAACIKRMQLAVPGGGCFSRWLIGRLAKGAGGKGSLENNGPRVDSNILMKLASSWYTDGIPRSSPVPGA